MIPLYGCLAGGGKLYSLDDPAVVVDGAALDGTGGTPFAPFIVTAPFNLLADLGYNKLRRFLQRLAHTGACTVLVTPIRDGRDSATVIVRPLALGDVGVVNVPLGDSASDFQLRLDVTDFDGEVALGDSQVFVVPRREYR